MRPGGPEPLNSNSIFCSMSISPCNYLKVFCAKRELLLKNGIYIRCLRLLTMLFPGRIYVVLCPWYFGDFCNIFLPNISKDQKKVLPSELGALALCHMVNANG